ncbi:MAG TPA: histidine triad nucleotide-binding protein [Armatimonadota bacterium]|nr:histidine triad nucleotide-binding protein [Armatimonadota bacterium]
MEGCIFCKIANHEIPSRIVYEDDEILAFRDVNPVAPVHILVIPKRHIPGITSLAEEDKDVVGSILLAAGKLAQDEGIAESGFRVVGNQGENAGQSVPHLHFHVLGGRPMHWPPG